MVAVGVLSLAVFAGKVVSFHALYMGHSPIGRSAMEQLGISPSFRGAYGLSLEIVLAVVCFAVALLLARYRSDYLPALLAATALLAFAGSGGTLMRLVHLNARWFLPAAVLGFTDRIAFLAFVYVFPDGRFIPPWTRWLTLCWAVLVLLIVLPAGVPFSTANWPPVLSLSMELLPLATLLYAQVYRYRQVSDARQREQTRWVVYGIVIVLVVYFVANASSYVAPSLGLSSAAGLLLEMVVLALRDLSMLLIPLTIGIAILYHRLYDIDVIINHTLVYGLLTAILAGLFSATVVLLQKLFVALTGQKSDGATVLATLVIVAGFTPIKNRVQEMVDQRFKGPPGRVKRLQAFGEQVRLRLTPVEARPLMGRLLEEAVSAFDAEGGCATLEEPGATRLIQTAEGWQGEAALALSLSVGDRELGTLSLGARRDGRTYTARDRALLSPVVGAVAEAIAHDRVGAV